MNFSELILLAFALSIDACVVAFSYGLSIENKKRLSSLALATCTGFFQAFMPVIGYFFTDLVKTFIEPYSRFIVFIIFAYLGYTFIKEGLIKEKPKKVKPIKEEKPKIIKEKPKKLCVSLKALFLIGIATSIDAFSAGISLSLTNTSIKLSALLIGAITFINTLIGYWSGYGLKVFNPKYLQILGGLILIGLAIKNLF